MCPALTNTNSRRRHFDTWSDNANNADIDDDASETTVPDEAETASATTAATSATSGSKRQRILEILKDNEYEPMSVYKSDPILYGNNASFVETICKAQRKLSYDQQPRAWKTTVHVYTGAPGSGKTYHALRRMKGLAPMAIYDKDDTQWWPDYVQQPIVFMDDYADTLPWQTLLRLMSQLPDYVPVKNSQAVFNARHLFITTHREPTEWYKGVSEFNVQALLDRIDEWISFEYNADTSSYSRKKRSGYKTGRRLFETLAAVEPLLDEDEEEDGGGQTPTETTSCSSASTGTDSAVSMTVPAGDGLMPERIIGRKPIHSSAHN